MPTFKEFLKVAQVTVSDKTSGRRTREITSILRKHGILKGPTPEKLTAILEDLGPTYVKIGQLMSNRSDILPKEYCDALSRLRTQVPPMTFEDVIQQIEQSYGTPWNKTFSSIEEKPLGSASIAQVHKGSLHDGSVVAIKIQRPGIAQQMAEDITMMRHALAIAEFSLNDDRMVLSFDDLLNELEKTTAEELDFTIELENLEKFYQCMEQQDGVQSPFPYKDCSTENILVMEFVVGTLIDHREKLNEEDCDLSKIGERLAQSYVTQVIDDGFFHADPHPGNIVIRGKEIVWIDLGMTGTLSAGERALVGKIFKAVATNNSYELKETLLSLAKAHGPVDHGLLLEQMDSMLATYASLELKDINIGIAFMDIIEILRTQKLSLPTSFTMLARGFVTLEGVVSGIAPNISVVEIVSMHVENQMQDMQSVRTKIKEAASASIDSAQALTELPTRLSNSLDMLDRGQLKFNMDAKVPESFIATLYSITGNLALAFISAGLFIGSSILCTTGMEPRILGVPAIGFLGFLGAFLLGIYVIWRTLVTRHQQRNNLKID